MKPEPSRSDLNFYAEEMFEELEFLVTHCLETETLEYANGSTYEVEVIKVDPSTTKRIKALAAEILSPTSKTGLLK